MDAEYLSNGTRYRRSLNGILIGTYTRPTQLSFRMTLSDLAKYSMRQLSFLLFVETVVVAWRRLLRQVLRAERRWLRDRRRSSTDL